MAPIENTVDAAKGAGAGIAGTLAMDASGGLDVAGRVAGDVLRGIFGGLPWEMSPGEIVDAVVPNFLPDVVPGAADEAAAMVVPYAVDAVGVLV